MRIITSMESRLQMVNFSQYLGWIVHTNVPALRQTSGTLLASHIWTDTSPLKEKHFRLVLQPLLDSCHRKSCSLTLIDHLFTREVEELLRCRLIVPPMASGERQPRKIAIQNVRIFDGHRVGEPTTVFIDDGMISPEVDGAEQVDGRGGVLLPGFIDAHIHLNTEKELWAMAQHGITTGLDMATWPPSKIQALRGIVGTTDFRTPGAPATTPGSLHTVLLPIPAEALINNPEEAVEFVRRRVAENVDYIKMIADEPGPDQASLNAIVVEAHKHGKLVVAHAAAFHPFQMAQDAGADVLTHCPVDKVLDEQACLRMVNDGRISVPTLVMMEATTGALSWKAILSLLQHPVTVWGVVKAMRKSPRAGKPTYTNARDSVAALHRAGVTILAGTDAHKEDLSPFSIVHGESLHRELELLVEAGLSTVEALQAATSLPAKHFGLGDRGVIEVGKRADLVLLAENPVDDIRASRSIRKVWCAGHEVVYRDMSLL